MNNRLDKNSTSPIKYKDLLRKQAQDELKQFSTSGSGRARETNRETFNVMNDTADQVMQNNQLEELRKQQQMVQQRYGSLNGSPATAVGSYTYTPIEGRQSSIVAHGGVTQRFGNVNPSVEVFNKRGINTGTDFSTPIGTPVAVPPGRWRVVDAFGGAKGHGYIGNNVNSGYGNSVLVVNEDTGEKMRFSHLSRVSVQPNSVVEGGSVIGLTGATGNVTGPHLDLEYYDANGQATDILRSIYAQFLGIK